MTTSAAEGSTATPSEISFEAFYLTSAQVDSYSAAVGSVIEDRDHLIDGGSGSDDWTTSVHTVADALDWEGPEYTIEVSFDDPGAEQSVLSEIAYAALDLIVPRPTDEGEGTVDADVYDSIVNADPQHRCPFHRITGDAVPRVVERHTASMLGLRPTAEYVLLCPYRADDSEGYPSP